MSKSNRSGGAFHGVSEFFAAASVPMSLPQLARKLGYSMDNILILEGDEEGLKSQFPDTYNAAMSCSHNMDARTPFAYAQDVVASWLFENFFVKKGNQAIEKLGINAKIELSGGDKDRKLLPGIKVSSSSDCAFIYEGIRIPVEIMCDYTGYFKKQKRMDLRDDKYEKLSSEGSVLVGVITPSAEYIIADFASEQPAEVRYHNLWHKFVHTVPIGKNVSLYSFSMGNVINTLTEIAKQRQQLSKKLHNEEKAS